MSQMPQPGAAHERMARRAGVWEGEETMAPSEWAPEGMEARGTTRARMALGGFALIGDYRQEADGRVTYEGHSVMTWSPQEEIYRLYWFDSLGSPVNVFEGGWEDGTLVLVGPGPGGGRMRQRSTLGEDGVLRTLADSSSDGETWTLLFEGTYRRHAS